MGENLFLDGEYIGPTIVIVGATASGKTGLSIKLAKRIEVEGIKCEIISADSKAIFKEITVGTAKPTIEEMNGIIHHGIDLIDPNERFSVYEYKKYTEQKIYEIKKRGNVPIIVGGTGLYVDAVIYDYNFDDKNKDFKHGTILGNGNLKSDGKEFVRQEKLDTDREEMNKNFIVFGIDRDNNELRVRLRKRIEKMMSEQLFDEMRGLEKKYGVQIFEIAGNIYKISWEYLRGILPYNEAIEQAFYKDYHLAKRQLTWFRRNPEIIWCNENEIIARVLKIFTHS